MSGVQAHVGGAAAAAATAIGARAYATGDAVAFAAAPDLRQAAHEAAHVVQQRGGVRLDGGVGRVGDPYEQHADAVADLVVRGASAEGLLDTLAHRGAAGGPAVQRDATTDALRLQVRGPWLALLGPLEAAPAFGDAQLLPFRNAVYTHLLERAAEFTGMTAYLHAVPTLAPAYDAAQAVAAAVELDRAHVQSIREAVSRFGGSGDAAEAQGICLAAYAQVTPVGRRWLQQQEWVRALGPAVDLTPPAAPTDAVEVPPEAARDQARGALFRLLGGSGGLISAEATVAPPAAVAAPTVPAEVTRAAAGFVRRILALHTEGREVAAETDARQALVTELRAADSRALDLVRENREVGVRMVALSQLDLDPEIPGMTSSLVLALDSVDQLRFTMLRAADEPAKFAAIRRYLEARPGAAALAARRRVLEERAIREQITSLSDEHQRDVSRLVARGTLTPQPVDIIYDLGNGRGNAADALRAALQLAHSPDLAALRGDEVFRIALDSSGARQQVTVEGLTTSVRDFVLRLWGVDPGAAADPEAARPGEVNPGAEEPLTETDWRVLNTLLDGTVTRLAPLLTNWAGDWNVAEPPIINELLAFENASAVPATRDLFRRAHLVPGPELVRRANASPIGNLRDRLMRVVWDEGRRQVAERVLGIRADAAAIGRIGGDVHLAGDALTGTTAPTDGTRLVPIEQALREVRTEGGRGPTVSQAARQAAETLAGGAGFGQWEWDHRIDGTEVLAPWRILRDRVEGVKPELARLTGLQPDRIHAIELLVNSFHEVPGGGDLAARVRDNVEEADVATVQRELGLRAEDVAARSRLDAAARVATTAEARHGALATELWTTLNAALHQDNDGDDTTHTLDSHAIEVAGEVWARGRAADATPAAPAASGAAAPPTFAAYYRTRYGIEPERHVVEVARGLASYAGADEVPWLARALHVDAGRITAAVGAGTEALAATASGFTPAQATAAANELLTALRGGDVVQVRRVLEGRRRDEQQLITTAFRNLTGGIELAFYMEQAATQAGASSTEHRMMAGGEGAHGAGAPAEGASILAARGDARSWTEAADIARTGEVGIVVRIRVALDNGDRNEIFRICDAATPEQRRTVVGDDATMARIRTTLTGVDYDRVYGVLAGSADMATRLYARSEGDVSSGVARFFSGVDTDGMRRDIRALAARRREVHARALEAAGRAVDDDVVRAAVREDLLRVYDSPDVRRIIDDELDGTSSPFADDADRRDVEGMLLNGGEASGAARVLSGDFEWSSDILAQVRTMPLAQRQRYRGDPEFLRRLSEHVTNMVTHRLIQLALASDEAPGEDHILRLAELHYEGGAAAAIAMEAAHLSAAEIPRLRNDPQLVAQLCTHLNGPQQANLRALLGFDSAAAATAVGATAVPAAAAAPTGPDAPPPTYRVGHAHGVATEAEVQRLAFLRHSAISRLSIAAGTSWLRLVAETVEVFKMDLRPALAVPPLPPDFVGPPAPPPDLAADARDEATRVRAEIWTAVASAVRARIDDGGDSDIGDDHAAALTAIQDGVAGRHDPSRLLLRAGLNLSWWNPMGNERDAIDTTIRNASAALIIDEWSSVKERKFPGAGGESLRDVYGELRARREAPAADAAAVRALTTRFQRYVIEPSYMFEGILLQHTGRGEAEARTSRAGQQLDRDNPEWAQYRATLNERIRALPPAQIATAIGATGPDAALIGTNLRAAETGLSIARERHALERGDGYDGIAADRGRELDRALGDYERAVGRAEDHTAATGTDISGADARALGALDAEVGERATEYRAAREQAAQVASLVVSAAIGAIMTALLPGAGTVAAMALYAALTSAAAATGEVLTREYVMGRTYDASGDGLRTIAGAAATGVLSAGAQYYAAQLVRGLAPLAATGSAAQQAELVATATAWRPPAWQRILQDGAIAATSSTMTGFGTALGSGLDPNLWRHGWDEAWIREQATLMPQLRGIPLAALRSAVTSMIGSAVAGSADPVGDEMPGGPGVMRGEATGAGRVLDAIRADLAQNTVTAAADVAWGTATGEVSSLRDAAGSLGTALAGNIRDVGMGMHQGAVERSHAEAFARHEATTHADLFATPAERDLYVSAVLNTPAVGEPLSAAAFLAARELVARSNHAGFDMLPAATQRDYVRWVREAPTAAEFRERAGRSPLEALADITAARGARAPEAAPEVRHDPTTPAGQAQQLLYTIQDARDRLNGLVSRALELEGRYGAAPTPAEAEECMRLMRTIVAEAQGQLGSAERAAASVPPVRELVAGDTPAARGARTEVDRLLQQAQVALNQVRGASTELGLSVSALRRDIADGGHTVTEPPARPAASPRATAEATPVAGRRFVRVEPGAGPEHLPADLTSPETAAFAAAREVYLRLAADPYQGPAAAARAWAEHLHRAGIDVPTTAVHDPRTAIHEVTDRPPEVRAAEGTVAPLAGGDFRAGVRPATQGPLTPAAVHAALAGLAGSSALAGATVTGDRIRVDLGEGRHLTIVVGPPAATASGAVAGHSYTPGAETCDAWVSTTILDEHVARALAGVIAEVRARAAGAGPTPAEAAQRAQLDVMLRRADELATPMAAPAVTRDRDRAPVAPPPIETQARVRAELDQLLHEMGLLVPGAERDRRLAALPEALRTRLETHLREAAVGFDPRAVVPDAAVLLRPAPADPTTLRASSVLPPSPTGELRPYGAADLPHVIELRAHLATIAEIDSRLAERDRTGDQAAAAAVARGESLRRREHVERAMALLELLQLGGTDEAYINSRLDELARVFPGSNLRDAVRARVSRRRAAEAAHARAEAARARIASRRGELTAAVNGADPLTVTRLIVGAGMTGLTDAATLQDGNPPGFPGLLMLGFDDPISARDAGALWGQRAGVFEGGAGADPLATHPLFRGAGDDGAAGVVEDPGEFMHIGELRDALDLARDRLGVAAYPGAAGPVEHRDAHTAATAAATADGSAPPPAWEDPACPVRVPMTGTDGRTRFVYAHHVDITVGPGATRMPNEGILSAADRRALATSGVLVGGNDLLNESRPEATGGRIFVYGFSPTGAWASTHAADTLDADHVDWGGSMATADGNARSMATTRGLDRTQDAFSDADIHRTTDPVIGMRPGATGGVDITFAHPDGHNYTVHYDRVAVAMGFDMDGTSGSPGGELPASGRMVASLDMRPVPVVDGRAPPVIESADGSVRVLGPSASFAPGLDREERNELLTRQRAEITRLSADSPTADTMEFGGRTIELANAGVRRGGGGSGGTP